MADERKKTRKWSLEEIDELLQDSGMLQNGSDALEFVEEIEHTPKAVSFNPRPSHNENIEHRIITDTVERSDSVAEPQVYGTFVSEKYRNRFFNKPIQNLEKTAEHRIVPPEEQKYERGGFVKKQSNFTHTSDFSPVPNLVPDHKAGDMEATEKTVVFDDMQHTKTIGLRSLAVTDGDAHDIELPEEDDGAQLTFEGFHDSDVEIVDEREVEEQLIKKRKEKASKFTVTSEPDEPENNEPVKKYGTDEYRMPDDKFKVSYFLRKQKNTAVMGAVVSFISFFVLLVISLIAKNFDTGGTVFVIASILLTIAPCVVNFNCIVDGVKGFKGFKLNRDTGVFLGIVAALVQEFAFLFTSDPFEKGISLFGAVAVLSMGLNLVARVIEIQRISENFSYMTEKEEIYAVGPIEQGETAFEIGRGLLLEEPVIISSQKTLFPRRFVELSSKFYPSDYIARKLIPISLGVSVLIGLISLIVTKHLVSGISAFTAALCISLPYFSFIADAIAIKKVSEKTRNKGGMIAGWDALRTCENANAVTVDSADIFDEEGGNVYGIHLFYDMEIDEAIINTAALVIASGGPLGNLFKRVIVGEVSLLPPVDTLAYEEKLGLSAWIFNRRVLVGNADLLKNHNVEIPDKALIEKHLCEGRYPLYLALDGKAAAVFIISYDINTANARLLKNIESNSISLLVRSDDANITDTMVANKLNLPLSGVKILSAVSGDLYKSYESCTTSAADALLLHDGKTTSFLHCIKSALSLSAIKQVIHIFQLCAMGIGVAVVAVLALVSGLSNLNCLQMAFMQLFFTAISLFALTGTHIVHNFERKKRVGKVKITNRQRPAKVRRR